MTRWRRGGAVETLEPVEPYCGLRKTCILQRNCSKTCMLASCHARRPADEPPGAHDGLRTSLLASKTAFGRLFWRPRRPPDQSPGAQDGLWTGLLAPQTACRRVSWRPRRPLNGSLSAQDSSQRVSLSAKTASGRGSLALDVFALLTV